MAQSDSIRWDKRYQDPQYEHPLPPRRLLVENVSLLPKGGRALDIAAGTGRNARFLEQHGFQVIGVDVSWQALRRAARFAPTSHWVLADLECFSIPECAFDLILNFYYLQRNLWPVFCQALRPGGLLFLETLTQDMRLRRTDLQDCNLLAAGELKTAFPNMETLYHSEGWFESDHGKQKAVASLIARRPMEGR